MNDKVINSRISHIFNLFSQVIVMQIQSLYEEYEDIDIDEIEKNYKLNYKNLLDKSSRELDISSIMREFILIEEDTYGLDTKEHDIKNNIENIFHDFSRSLSVESMMLRDKWKKEQVGELEENISYLNDAVKKLSKIKNTLEDELENEKNKSDDLKNELNQFIKLNSDLIKKSKLSEEKLQNIRQKLENQDKKNEVLSRQNRDLKIEVQDLKYQNNNLVLDKQRLKQEKLNLDEKVKEFQHNISELKNKIKLIEMQTSKEGKEISKTNNDEMKRLKQEYEHLKKGLYLLQSQVKDREKTIDDILGEKNKIYKNYETILNENREIKKVSNQLKDTLKVKDKTIKELEKQIKTVNTRRNIPKVNISNIHYEFNNIYNQVFERLKKIAMLTKNVEGKSIMMIASKIHKIATNIKSCEDINEIEEILNIFILELSNLNKLLEKNNKESGLIQYIDILVKLKNKI